ncbi:hypothetical protein [Deinococcus arenicola]|uniref:Calcineurin-like phosphoesterase domain-containing protein n=1 Tax=Deinococcus arenicola TaxID=2994950 RepID=A0ABU4DTK8_9DEIO|nr:hypothetical protein [Deinococcus sp. ZS9-10]MDV6375767.1 hypothetical protein [Deinococcus sp. ZS9-10]
MNVAKGGRSAGTRRVSWGHRATLALASSVAAALLASASAAPFKFMALGDMPYTLPADYARFEALIGTVNTLKPAFTVHVGDIKSGSTPCTDEAFLKVRGEFGMFDGPLVYTPGDNEWTDCHREKAGKYDPLERLAKIRELFFTSQGAQSFGKQPMPLTRQPGLIENSRWNHEGVVFGTVHVIGSNNGMERTPQSTAEYFTRNAANMDWIKATFAEAKAKNAPAVVIAFQADLWYGAPVLLTDIGLRDTLTTLAAESKTYGKPVLLIHGDSHIMVIDHPLTEAGAMTALGQVSPPLRNVTRLMVMGESDVGAVEVSVDPADPAVFGFKPVYSKPAAASAQGK